MSPHLLWTAAALIASLLLLLPLALRDPKRLRSAKRGVGDAGVPLKAGTRRLLGWSCLIPGLGLIAVGQWSAFLIWLGAVTAAGWALAHFLAPRS